MTAPRDDELYDLAFGPPNPHQGPVDHDEWGDDDLEWIPDDWNPRLVGSGRPRPPLVLVGDIDWSEETHAAA